MFSIFSRADLLLRISPTSTSRCGKYTIHLRYKERYDFHCSTALRDDVLYRISPKPLSTVINSFTPCNDEGRSRVSRNSYMNFHKNSTNRLVSGYRWKEGRDLYFLFHKDGVKWLARSAS